MRCKYLFFHIIILLNLLSCSNDDENGYVPGIPVLDPQGFEVSETITDSETIGIIQAEDPNGDPLSFRIAADKSGLFNVSNSGELSLERDKVLDYETATEHQFTVRVTDGKGEFFNYVTVMVLDVNEPPLAENQSFAVNENISDTDNFGTIQANDPENDALTFTIAANDNGLFDITQDGRLNLTDGATLDFETAEFHEITVAVDDGINEPVMVQVIVNVTDITEADPRDAAAFVTTWTTTNANESIGFDQNNANNTDYEYNFTINWGDGIVETLTVGMGFEHEYASPGIYTISIIGDLPYINVMDAYQDRLTSIDKWGAVVWQSMLASFASASNMQVLADDIPNLSQVESLQNMFDSCSNLVDLGNNDWDVGNISDFSNLFRSCSSFDGDISSWNVVGATNMAGMFQGATDFNQNIGGWNVENVIEFSGMFFGANRFNQDISGWDMGNADRLYFMFAFADSFNQNVGGWDVSNITDLEGMFSGAEAFDQDLGSWELNSNGVAMGAMLSNSGLSPANYADTLFGWADNPNTPDNINLGAVGLTYCSDPGTISRGFLVGNKGWSITDDGPVNCP